MNARPCSHLVDEDDAVSGALRAAFASTPEVRVERGDLLEVAHTAIVSPGNGFGFMDGGIDRRYVAFFGSQLERAVRDIAYLIVAPTVLLPEDVSSQHSCRAMRAVLRTDAANDFLTDVFCPGLGTGVGRVAPHDAAREMFEAYSDWLRAASA